MAELVSIKRNVDVSPGQAAPAVFHCSQGDVGSKIILGLLNNGTAYSIPSGVTVTIEGSESNGSIFTPISATASESDITFNLTGEMTAVAGPAICQAVLKSGSNILGTANFTLEVESSPMGADAPPVFTDAGWTWMLNKLTTEFVPALGDNIIDAIESKAVAKTVNETINAIETTTAGLSDELYNYSSKSVYETTTDRRLTGVNGLAEANSDYKLVKYSVNQGDVIMVVSDDRFQFQTNGSVVPITGTNSRLVGVTYGQHNGVLIVPATANYIVMSTPASDGTAVVYDATIKIDPQEIETIKTNYPALMRGVLTISAFTNGALWTFGEGVQANTGYTTTNSRYARTAWASIDAPVMVCIDNPDYEFTVWGYSSPSSTAGTYSPKVDYNALPAIIQPINGTTKFRIGVRRVDGANITTPYSDTTTDAYKIISALKTYSLTDKTLSVENAPADGKATGDEFDRVDSNIASLKETLGSMLRKTTIDPSGVERLRWAINPRNAWAAIDYSSNTRGCVVKVPDLCNKIRLEFDTAGGVYALLNSFEPVDTQTPDFSDGYNTRISVTETGSIEYSRTANMNYIYFLGSNSSGTDVSPSEITFFEKNVVSNIPTGTLSSVPVYKVVDDIYTDSYIHDVYSFNGIVYNNTQGICADDTHIYYALRTFDVNNVSGISFIKKVNAFTLDTVAFNTNPSANYGHCEDMCFVPGYVGGFDSGTANRIYIVDLDRSPSHQTGRYIHAVNADTLEYISSFATDTIFQNVTGWAGASGITFNRERGLFALKGAISGDTDHNTGLIVCDATGGYVRGIVANVNGTGAGIDSDENFIYYLRYVSTAEENVFNIKLNVFDWGLIPVAEATIAQYDWEIEGICHIGNSVFASWNEISTARTGIDISKSIGIKYGFYAGSQDLPGWSGGFYNISTI